MDMIDYSQFLGIKAFTSAGPIDFKQGDPAASHYVLTAAQSKYLLSHGIPGDHGAVLPKQVHGDVVWEVAAKDLMKAGVVEADAVVTGVKGLPIAIRTADCLPALLYDPQKKVIAAVHAGWKSTRLDIARKTVERMVRDFGVDPADIRAAIGPCIRKQSCAVGPEFREYFPQEVFGPEGKLHFDIVAANVRQLAEAGVNKANIFDCGGDSFADKARFHSFRRDGEASGRMISVVMM